MMSNNRIIPPGEVLPPMLSPEELARQEQRQQAKTQQQSKPKRSGKTAERFVVLNQFVDTAMAELSRAEVKAWMVLYRDTRNGTARTSITDMAKRIGADKRTAIRAVNMLVKVGLVVRVYRGGMNRGVSIYRVAPCRKMTAQRVTPVSP